MIPLRPTMGAEVQALWFRADVWTRSAASDWCADKGFEPVTWRSRLDPGGETTHHIAVIFQPDEADADSFRTIADDFPDGVSATVAERKSMGAINKTGEQSAGDPFTFVMSTDSVDRDGDIVRPDGVSLTNFKRNPVALFGHDHKSPIGVWENVRVEGRKLVGDLKLAAKGTSEFIDTLHKLVEQRILRAVSIGFRAKEYDWLPGKTGLDFSETELLECSLVAVPANQQALRVKAAAMVPENLSETFLPTAGKGSSTRARKPSVAPPKSAQKGLDPKQQPSDKRKKPMNIAERIAAKNERLVAVKDRLTEIKALLDADSEYELTDEEQEELDTLSDEQESLSKSIDALNKIETGLARKAAPVSRVPNPTAGRASVPARAAPQEKGGSLLIKVMSASVVAKMTGETVKETVAAMYPNDDRILPVAKSLVMAGNGGDRVLKSAVDAADTTTPGWAAELVRDDLRGFMTELEAFSIYAALVARGEPLDFGTANSITIPARNRANQNNGAEMGGSWVGEGGVIPVKQMALTSQTLNRYKMAVISAFTGELLQQSVPNIEGLVRSAILEDTALALDFALLSAWPMAPGVRPAGLRAGVTATPSSGDDAAAIIADLKVLFGAMSAINGARPVLIMNSNRLLGLSTVTTVAGGFMFRDEIAQGRLLGVPVLSSTTVPADIVLIVDANSFAGANAAPNFNVSDQATLVMANADGVAPTQAGDASDHTGGDLGTAEEVNPDGGIVVTGDTTAAPAGTSVTGYHAQSMWQQYQTAVRMILPTGWGLTRAGAVAALSGVDW